MALLQWLKNNSLTFLILLLGLFLFTIKLDSIPPAVSNDESVVGINALSILQTGKDEYGQYFPVNFKFFGSFTPGLFVYLQTIPIKIFGLNPFSLRILSAVSMTILAYFICKKIGNLAGLIFIITPWVIFNARLGYETTFAFALMSLGLLFYKNPTLSFSILSLSAYSGHSERYLAPIFILLIWLIFYRRQKIYRSFIMALIIQIPNIFLLFTPSFWVKNNSFTSSFISQYLSYFNPQNLFATEDYHLQRSIPQMSVFYSWMFLPWFVGLYQIYKNIDQKYYQYLLGLILISPLPAALANTNYSTQRALPLLLPYILIITHGIRHIIKNKIIKILIIILIPISFIYLFRSYFILLPKQRAQAWDYGYQQLADFTRQNTSKKFIVDNSRSVPYSLVLFYLSPSMADYQTQNNFTGVNYYSNLNFSGQAKINNISVRPIIWKEDIYIDQIIVGDALAISKSQVKEHFLTKVFEVTDYRQQILLQGYQTNPKLKLESDRSKIQFTK